MQSGLEYEFEGRPIINKPPPRHQGVHPNPGNITPVPKPIQTYIERYTPHDVRRPTVEEHYYTFKQTGSNVPPLNYNSYDAPSTPPKNYNPPPPQTHTYSLPPNMFPIPLQFTPSHRPVVPPAYNQDYIVTTNQNDNYPGHDSYDGGITNDDYTEYYYNIDTIQEDTDNYGQKYNGHDNMAPDSKPPTRRPPTSYQELVPDKEPVYNYNPIPSSTEVTDPSHSYTTQTPPQF